MPASMYIGMSQDLATMEHMSMRNPSEVSSAEAWQGTWRSPCIGVAGSARGCVLKVASPAVRSFVFV